MNYTFKNTLKELLILLVDIMRIKSLLLSLIIILLIAKLPFNMYTQLPYWVNQGVYAEYHGETSQTRTSDNTTFTINVSVHLKLKVEAYGDYVHVYEFRNVTTLIYCEGCNTSLTNSSVKETRIKIIPETATTENGSYCLFFVSKNVEIGDSVSVEGDIGSVIDETYVDTYMDSWQNRRSLIVQIVTKDINYRLYYDKKARILLGLDMTFKNITIGGLPLTVEVRLFDTNVQPPSILIDIILLFENPFYVIVFGVIIFFIVLIIVVKRRVSKQYVKEGRIKVMPGVERLR